MADKKSKQRGLGRGLSALMADVNEAKTAPSDGAAPAEQNVPIEKVVPNPDQPRRHFEQDALQDLAASISEKGIIQPLIVRPSPNPKSDYEIVAGERRWRAAQLAQLHEVPVIVRDFDDVEVLEVAIIENVQRADLNPIEEALGYSQLMEKFGHTQEKLATALGKSRSYIANAVRLLGLPEEVRGFLQSGELTAGHARALITAEDPIALAKEIVKKGLSVRDAEKLAKTVSNTGKSDKKPSTHKTSEKDADTKALEGDLSANLGMRVSIDHKPGTEGGQLAISYDSFDQLDDLCRMLSLGK